MPQSFHSWWATQSDGGHRHQTEAWFEKYAYELLCLFPKGRTLLDVGCGNAQVLSYLAPHYTEAIGIDYSVKMLEAADARIRKLGIRNIRLELGDACHFPESIRRADVVLSVGVAQYMEPQDIRSHLQECRRVLQPSGTVGICDVPWANLRSAFLSGRLHDPPTQGIPGRIASALRLRIRMLSGFRRSAPADGIGVWYTRDRIRSLAQAEGFDCETVTSWHYEYRFHAVLRPIVSTD